MKMLLIILLVYFALRLVGRAWGGNILQFFVVRLVRKMQNDASRYAQNQSQYSSSFRQEKSVNEDMNIHVPREPRSPKKEPSFQHAEEVEFEEIKN